MSEKHEPQRTLPEIRVEIDALDRQLIEILNRRASLAKEVGVVKGQDGKPFFTPEREHQIYERLRIENPGPLQSRQLVGIFREIISAARAAEKPLTSAYWGPAGTFSQIAALQAFGTSSELLACDSIAEVFASVEQNRADYGVVPIENSAAGIVQETVDVFQQTSVKICAELYVRIEHHLVSLATDLSEIKRVYAGPQPSQQCRRWLELNLPKAELVDCAPTAKAAERALHDPEAAAIANRVAADIIGIPIRAENIHDHSSNRTRFLVIGFNEPARTGKDKTTLTIHLNNRPGELYRALGALDANKVNMILIESRPVHRGNFEYVFYIDVSGHWQDQNIRDALDDLRKHALQVSVLGSYPQADPSEAG